MKRLAQSDFCHRQTHQFRRWWLLCLLLVLLMPCFAQADSNSLVGTALSRYLDAMQDQGFDIVYSSSLVPDDMRIRFDPGTGLPRDRLKKILAPLGLSLQVDNAGRWLVVRNPRGTVIGRVWNARDDLPVAGAEVFYHYNRDPIVTIESGLFAVLDLEPGTLSLRAQASGFGDGINTVQVAAGEVAEVELLISPLILEPLVINPSQYSLLSDEPSSRLFLSREQIDRTPHLADDTYRAVHRLPGIAAGDFATTFFVRGGAADEVQIVLDGMSLVDPFHLKDLGNAFSTVDSNIVAGMDLITGNFPSVYGERLSGVMDVSTIVPSNEGRNAAGISFSNAFAVIERSNETGDTRWMGSARAGYLDIILGFVEPDEEISPEYYDVFVKYEHDLNADSRLFFNVLGSLDKLDFVDDNFSDNAISDFFADYHNIQAWGGIDTWLNPDAHARLQFEIGTLAGQRSGFGDDPFDQFFNFVDDRELNFVGLSANLEQQIGYDHTLSLGANARYYSASYNYVSTNFLFEPVFGERPSGLYELDIQESPTGTDLGLFVSDRWQFQDTLTLEAGLRWDRQSWTDEDYFSPRANLAWRVNERSVVRAGWGRYYQAQQLYELQVEDGLTEFFPAQRANQTVLGFEHLFDSQVLLRVEAYDKDMDRLRPRFENLYEGISVPPEHSEDRVRVDPEAAISRGVEFLVSHEGNRPFSWWASFTYAKADDIIDGVAVPRSWDQRRAVSVGLNWQVVDWNWNILGHYHSGWPRTPLELSVEEIDGELVFVGNVGPRNSERYDSYTRFDLRVSRVKQFSDSKLTYFFELYNILDAENPCCVDSFNAFFNPAGTLVTTTNLDQWLPRFPSLGFVYEWR